MIGGIIENGEMKLYQEVIYHLEVRNEELQVSRKEWVDKAQASEKECQRLFEENERLTELVEDKNVQYIKLDRVYDELNTKYVQLKDRIQTQGADVEKEEVILPITDFSDV